MSNDLMIVGNGPMQLPAHLAGLNFGVTAELMQGITVGGNRIGLKGSRFRLIVNGVEEGVFEENYLDVIVLGAAPAVSRQYYEGAYNSSGENKPPVCYSADGIVPAADVKNKQSDKCMLCPQNAKGSKIVDGMQYKACGYFRRMVVMLAGDTEDRRVFKLDVKAQGLFGDGSKDGTKQGLNDYIKMVGNRGIDIAMLVTRISFDVNASVPKLLFAPYRYVTDEEVAAVQDLVHSDEVTNLKQVSMATIDLSGEVAADEGSAEAVQEVEEEAAAPTATPVAAKPQTPAKPAAAKPQTAPAPQRPAAAAPQKPVAQKPTVQSNVPVPQAAKPAAPKPAPAAAKPAPEVIEVGTDDELSDILKDLDI